MAVILLDTNAYTAFKRGHAGVVDCVRSAQAIAFSAVVAGELLYGFRNGSRYEKNLGELQAFLQSPFVTFVPISWTSADRYAEISAHLRKKGTPIPTNDIWIAAHTLESGARLVSFDAHFSAIADLPVLVPAQD